jgi:hypothetical protein
MRYTGVSMAYQIASLIGGFGPLVASLLIAGGLSPLWVIGMLLLGLLVSITCPLLIPRTDDVDLARIGEVRTTAPEPAQPVLVDGSAR